MPDTPVRPPNVNPSPKARFMAVQGNQSAHRAMMEKPEFDRAIDMAQMEYHRLLAGQATDGNSAMAAGFRAQGAIEFISILKTLAESTPTPTPRRDLDNLPPLDNLKRQ